MAGKIITAVDLDPRIQVITDDNWRDAVVPPSAAGDEWSSTGYVPRDEHESPYGSMAGTTSLPPWVMAQYGTKQARKERMAELKAKGMRVQDILQRAIERAKDHPRGKYVGLNQNPTNYCWTYGLIHQIMAERELNGEPFLRLSPYSVACIVKNFQNQGGWGSQACQQVIKEGVATEEFWPMEKPGMSSSERSAANMSAIRNGRQYLASSRANAALKKVSEYWELKPRNWEEKAACLCVPHPVASGYNWMGHERCSIDLCLLSNGDEGCVDQDSYTTDGGLDLKVLASSRGAGDDQVVGLVSSPSDV